MTILTRAEDALAKANTITLKNGASKANQAALAALKEDARGIITEAKAAPVPSPQPPVAPVTDYATTSPLYLPTSQGAVHPESAAIVSALGSMGSRCSFLAGYNAHTYNHPVYQATSSDPLYMLKLTSAYGADPAFGGREIHVPKGALPEGGSDHHMGVIQPDGTEVDVYCVESIVAGSPGLITAHNAGIPDANGLNGRSTAAGFGLRFGSITAEELITGTPRKEALFMVVPRTNGTHVYPAAGNAAAGGGPPCGQWFGLNYTDSELAAHLAAITPWKRPIIERMAHFGLFAGDTGGDFVKGQSGAPFKASGQSDPMVELAKSLGIKEGIGEYVGTFRFDFSDAFDGSRLVALSPPAVI